MATSSPVSPQEMYPELLRRIKREHASNALPEDDVRRLIQYREAVETAIDDYSTVHHDINRDALLQVEHEMHRHLVSHIEKVAPRIYREQVDEILRADPCAAAASPGGSCVEHDSPARLALRQRLLDVIAVDREAFNGDKYIYLETRREFDLARFDLAGLKHRFCKELPATTGAGAASAAVEADSAAARRMGGAARSRAVSELPLLRKLRDAAAAVRYVFVKTQEESAQSGILDADGRQHLRAALADVDALLLALHGRICGNKMMLMPDGSVCDSSQGDHFLLCADLHKTKTWLGQLRQQQQQQESKASDPAAVVALAAQVDELLKPLEARRRGASDLVSSIGAAIHEKGIFAVLGAVVVAGAAAYYYIRNRKQQQ